MMNTLIKGALSPALAVYAAAWWLLAVSGLSVVAILVLMPSAQCGATPGATTHAHRRGGIRYCHLGCSPQEDSRPDSLSSYRMAVLVLP